MDDESPNERNETAISILNSYAFSKVSEYYADKGKTCILDEYQTQIIQYFTENELDIEMFYHSMIKKSDFVKNIIQYIDEQNGTENEDNYTLQTAIKKLFMILQFSQHATYKKNRSKPKQDINNVQQTQIDIPRRSSTRDSMVRDFAESASKLLTLQETADILRDVADEQQRKLIQIEEKEEEYKETVNELHEQLHSEKTRVFQINDVNKKLQDELNENKEKMQSMNHELSQKMNKLENENEKLKQLINELSMTKRNDLGNNYEESSEMKSTSDDIENTVSDGNGINLKRNNCSLLPSLSISNDTTMVTVNLESNITKSTELKKKDNLLILNEEHIANLSKFYQTMDVEEIQRENNKKKRMLKNKKNFLERLFDDFQCVPSWQ